MVKPSYGDLPPKEAESAVLTDAGSRQGPPAGIPDIEAPALKKASASYLTLISLANFGVAMAFIVPMSYSLAVRISQLAPGHEELLGYVTGTAQFISIAASPLVGVWSDRFRSRLGRRTPFMIGGALLGILGLLGISLAPSVLLIGLGWVFGLFGWAAAGQAILNLQADRIPEEQRGKISAFSGLSAQIAPVLGIGIAYAVSSSTLLVFLVPGLVGLALVALFSLVKREGSSVGLVHNSTVTVKALLTSYTFSPRKHPDFGWNWLGRFIFFMGLYFNTTFGSFFYAQRLGLPIKEVAGTVALIGMLGIVAATAGALTGGFLSDKLRRRRLFAFLGGLLFLAGGITEAYAHSFITLLVGALIMQCAIALFSAVDQAIIFAVLPDRAQAGRYLAVVGFAQRIPSAIAPLLAPFIIVLGAAGAEKNYTALYLTGAALALLGSLIIFLKIKSVR
ncbi:MULTISPECIES: MFS transporter [Arthrobacter]|uniref:MFS transporter n=1 Tax=Arthrobacter TaxID=1663 RepID=UPI0006A35B0B|nr:MULTISPECIES: MFS transporter [Arthrobacter]MDQ0239560.1 MFS family permease [Arthrobacter bambusae]GAP59820.1 major facilitator superfamily MFS_1 protein [Arthrobacter sp. Hiyo1]